MLVHHVALTSTVCLSHLSRFSERTFDTCTPKLRWTPEHLMHSTMPRFTLAHSITGRGGQITSKRRKRRR